MTGSNGDETTRSRTDISTQEEKVYNLLASDFKKGNGLTKYAIRTRTQIPQATALKVLSNLEDECLIIVKREKIRNRTVDICRLSNLGIVRLYRKGLLKQEDVEPLLEDWRGHFKQDMMRLGRKYKGTARGFADTKEEVRPMLEYVRKNDAIGAVLKMPKAAVKLWPDLDSKTRLALLKLLSEGKFEPDPQSPSWFKWDLNPSSVQSFAFDVHNHIANALVRPTSDEIKKLGDEGRREAIDWLVGLI